MDSPVDMEVDVQTDHEVQENQPKVSINKLTSDVISLTRAYMQALFDEPLIIEEGKRKRRGTTIYKDFLPSSAAPALAHVETALDMQFEPPPAPLPAKPRQREKIKADDMGLSREYIDLPTNEPDKPHLPTSEDYSHLWTGSKAPLRNITWFRLAHWANSGPKISNRELDRLVYEVLLATDFCASDLASFHAAQVNAALDAYNRTSQLVEDGWIESTVKVRLPAEGVKKSKEEAFPELEVEGLFHRPLVETITESLQSDIAHTLHYSPYAEYWTPTENSEPQRVYGELYTSDAWLEAHEEIRSSTAEDDKVENVVLPLMLWSDATHLTNFGSASLWPLYMFFGGHSKYIRGKPTSGTGHHLAYIPTLPKDKLQDLYMAVFGILASASMITHLKRELMHSVLLIVLLNPAFIEAYRDGILVKCVDHILRRFFPRLITYSADYPEK